MILHFDINKSYIVLLKSRIRCSGQFYVSNNNINNPSPNEPINTLYKTIRNLISSSVETKTFNESINAQAIIHIRIILEAMGHPQNQNGTYIKMNKRTSYEITTNLIKQRKSKKWNIRHH